MDGGDTPDLLAIQAGLPHGLVHPHPLRDPFEPHDLAVDKGIIAGAQIDGRVHHADKIMRGIGDSAREIARREPPAASAERRAEREPRSRRQAGEHGEFAARGALDRNAERQRFVGESLPALDDEPRRLEYGIG